MKTLRRTLRVDKPLSRVYDYLVDFVYGADVQIETGSPPALDPLAVPDADVFTLAGWFWW